MSLCVFIAVHVAASCYKSLVSPSRASAPAVLSVDIAAEDVSAYLICLLQGVEIEVSKLNTSIEQCEDMDMVAVHCCRRGAILRKVRA